MFVRSPDSLPGPDRADRPDRPDRPDLSDAARGVPVTRRRTAVRVADFAAGGGRAGGSSLSRLVRAVAVAVLATALLLTARWQLRAAPPPAAITAERVLAGVVARYAGVQHLAADLRVTTTSFSSHVTTERRGRLSLARGGKLRWDALPDGEDPRSAGPRRSLVSDGAALTLVDFAQRELVKLHRSDDQLVFATSTILSAALPADFTAELASLAGYQGDAGGLLRDEDPDRPRYALSLLPRSANPRAQRLILLVDARMNVRQLVVETPYGRTRLTLTDEDRRTPPAPSQFTVDPSAPELAGFRFVDAEL